MADPPSHGPGDRPGHPGVEVDVLGFDYHNVTDEERAALVAVRPREDFASRILAASTDGIKDRRDTTLDNVKADVLEHFVPGFLRGDFVEVIKNSDWLE